MKQTQLRSVLVLASLIAIQAYAGGDSPSGTRGGGQSVDINGRPALRDLVDSTVCEWMPMAKLLPRASYFPKILDSLSKAHWYLAASIPRIADELSVCKTEGPLVKLPENVWDDVTIYKVKTRQAAIRFDDRVYLDMSVFNKMEDKDRSYLLFHEIMHSYIPMDAGQRATKLRSFVAMVRKNELKPMASEDFAYQMSMDSLDIASTTVALDSVRADLTTALNPAVDLDMRQIAAFNAGTLTGLDADDAYELDSLKGALIHRVPNELIALLDKGLEPNKAVQLFDIKSLASHPEQLEALIRKGMDSNTVLGTTRLLNGVIGVISEGRKSSGHFDATPDAQAAMRAFYSLLVAPGIDPNQGNSVGDCVVVADAVVCKGGSALHDAANFAHYVGWEYPRNAAPIPGRVVDNGDLVTALLTVAGVDVNLPGPHGPPLFAAASAGATSSVTALLGAPGVQPNGLWDGKTALYVALESSGATAFCGGNCPVGFEATVQALLRSPAVDPNLGWYGQPPLILAVTNPFAYWGRRYSNIDALLSRADLDLNARDTADGHPHQTALMHALVSSYADNRYVIVDDISVEKLVHDPRLDACVRDGDAGSHHTAFEMISLMVRNLESDCAANRPRFDHAPSCLLDLERMKKVEAMLKPISQNCDRGERRKIP